MVFLGGMGVRGLLFKIEDLVWLLGRVGVGRSVWLDIFFWVGEVMFVGVF